VVRVALVKVHCSVVKKRHQKARQGVLIEDAFPNLNAKVKELQPAETLKHVRWHLERKDHTAESVQIKREVL